MSPTSSTVLSAGTTRTAGQYCTFWVAGLTFGVDVADVQEVLRWHDMSPVPRAPECVTGLINLRGQIVTALDLRLRLGLPPRADGVLPMNVVLRSRGEVVSLLVDDIGDVIDTEGQPLVPTPSNVPVQVSACLRGVLPRADAILLVLDPDLAADVAAQPVTPGGTP